MLKGNVMNVLKKCVLVTLATLALASGAASASVITHVHVALQSGATFDGDLTFADHYTALTGVDGYLVGTAYGNTHLVSPFNAPYLGTSDDATHATGIDGVLTDFLLNGDPVIGDYTHYLGISWLAPADALVFVFDSAIATAYAGVDASDRIVGVTVGGVTLPVTDLPEPAGLALLGLGLVGVAARRRKLG